jgi:deoxyribonuclease II
MKSLLTFVTAIVLCTSLVGGAVQCLNEQGNPVDWWVMLKLPKTSSSSSPAVRQGQAYVYLDADSQQFQFPDRALNASLHASLASTIAQVDQGATNLVGSLKYNDQWPDNSKHDSYGHTKGVVGFDSRTGFWLIHSVPRYPPTPYTYPDYAAKFGQSFLCVSYTLENINEIGAGLLLNKPAVFESNLPASIQADVPNLVDVVAKRWVKTPGTLRKSALPSLGGITFHTFAKNPAWDRRLWVDGVAPGIESPLFVESWMNGSGGRINSTCDGVSYPVYDITEVRAGGITWTETKDHSKWGVSTESRDGWSCIGDINRMESQERRGGGASCFRLPGVWKSLHSVIANSWPCPETV